MFASVKTLTSALLCRMKCLCLERGDGAAAIGNLNYLKLADDDQEIEKAYGDMRLIAVAEMMWMSWAAAFSKWRPLFNNSSCLQMCVLRHSQAAVTSDICFLNRPEFGEYIPTIENEMCSCCIWDKHRKRVLTQICM